MRQIATKVFRSISKGLTGKILLAVSTVLLACSFMETASAAERINFEHFSFDVPEDDTWIMLSSNSNSNVFVASTDKVDYQMTLIENVLEGWSSINRTAQSVADDSGDTRNKA